MLISEYFQKESIERSFVYNKDIINIEIIIMQAETNRFMHVFDYITILHVIYKDKVIYFTYKEKKIFDYFHAVKSPIFFPVSIINQI